MIVTKGAEQLEMAALEPPDHLVAQYEACQTLRQKIESGEVTNTQQGLSRWMSGGATRKENERRKAMVDAARRLLQQEKLAQADAQFVRAYLTYVTHNAAARASWMVAREMLRDGGTVEGHPLVVTLLQKGTAH